MWSIVGGVDGRGRTGLRFDPRPPSFTDAEWRAALNASDDYFYSESRGLGPDSSDSSDGDQRSGSVGGGSENAGSFGP